MKCPLQRSHLSITAALLIYAFIPAMAQVSQMPAYPLITHNPYFSIWSGTDQLNESETRHWTGKEQPLRGIARVDGKYYRFMGGPGPAGTTTGPGDGGVLKASQAAVDVSATQTTYTFTCGAVGLQVRFTSPLVITHL